MEDETLKHLQEARNRRKKRIIIVFISVMAALGILNVFLLMILGLSLMLIGASSMTEMGNAMLKWRYYKYMTSGFHELVKAENADRNKNFGIGIILVAAGFSIFFLSLYLISVGWFGLLTG